MPRRRVAAVAALALTLLVPAAPALATPAGGGGDDELVVRFDPTADDDQRRRALDRLGYELVEMPPGSDFALVRGRGTDLFRSAAAQPAVDGVEPVLRVEAHGVPNDPLYPAQWNLPMVQAPEAWDLTTGVGVTVAVLDTGVAYQDHLGYRLAPDLAETAFAPGWDFVNDDSRPNDDDGHGTHVAGTIAQSTDNGLGLAGVAHGARIMPLKVLDADGGGSDWDAASALRWAADHGATVANLSFGAASGSSVLADAIDYAHARGVTVVASSGNSGANTVAFPASHPSVIGVGAVRDNATLPAYSNRGTALDLVAPGGDVETDPDPDGIPNGIAQQTFFDDPATFCWCLFHGTSMAAPHVAGVAALAAAAGAVTPAAVRDALQATALDLGPNGHDNFYGFGLVQAEDAVRRAIAASRTARSITPACPPDDVQAASFADVSTSDVHGPAVDCIVWWGIANGLSANSYAPARPVTREQMASFVARAILSTGAILPADPTDAFADDEGSPHELRINQLAAIGVVSGRSPGIYGPRDLVTRAQMATFLVRTHDVVDGTPLPLVADVFSDDDGSAHEDNINRAAGASLVVGTGPGSFSPGSPVLRNQMASFVARTLALLVEEGHELHHVG